MNVRLAENEIRFRVSNEEFQALIAREPIRLDSEFINVVVQISQTVFSDGLRLDFSSRDLKLLLSPDEVKVLETRLPSKKGIETRVITTSGKELNIIFEVDLKNKL